MKKIFQLISLGIVLFIWIMPDIATAWNDETHIAIARAAGYAKWYNAAGADMAKLKAGDTESDNHFVNNLLDAEVSQEMVLQQAERYNRHDETGHLYGAILASLEAYRKNRRAGKYAEYHLAYCAHYVGDLSMPLHNIVYDDFNQTHHRQMDGIINDGILENPIRIELYAITIETESDLEEEIARIANLSIALAEKIETENRQLTSEEAYSQVSHSASLLRAILNYAGTPP